MHPLFLFSTGCGQIMEALAKASIFHEVRRVYMLFLFFRHYHAFRDHFHILFTIGRFSIQNGSAEFKAIYYHHIVSGWESNERHRQTDENQSNDGPEDCKTVQRDWICC